VGLPALHTVVVQVCSTLGRQSGVNLAAADKSSDNAVFDGPNPASRVSVSTQLTRQTTEYVQWRRTAIGEPGQIGGSCRFIPKGRQKAAFLVFATDTAGCSIYSAPV
jgi:hypothetical protein